MKASAKGMIQPVASPLPSRAATSSGSVGARPQSDHHQTVAAAAAKATQRYLPKRSPIGPISNCTEPCASR